MALSISCPNCETRLTATPDQIGQAIRCKACGESVTVKAPTAKALPAKPPTAKPISSSDAEIEAEELIIVEEDEGNPPKKAAKARPVADDAEKDDRPRKPVKKARVVVVEDDDDDDDRPRSQSKSSSKLPLILGLLFLMMLLGGGGGAAAYFLLKDEGHDISDATPTEPDSFRVPRTESRTPTEPGPATTPSTTPATIRPTTPVTQTIPTSTPRTVVVPMPPVTTRPDPKLPPPPKTEPDQLTLDRAKHATVYIECDDAQGGGGSGSGWFGIEEGLVFTNAHVLGMLRPGSNPPAKITLYINSGEPGKQVIIPSTRVKLLAVDQDMDLALLQVLGEQKLPLPMKVRASTTLRDLEKLTVLGFPGGRRLSMKNRSTDPPTVTVNPTSVMRLVKDSNQNLYSVQVSGGIVHGNSGGPIMDAEGQVVAVSVRVDLDQFGRLTNIAYGVPTEFVNGLVAGRAAGIEYGQAYNKDGKVHIPVIVRCLDPLGRLQNVGVAGWVGDSDAVPRAPGLNRAANSTDANYQEVALAYDPEKKVAAGELVFPALVPGRAYFAQPYYGNALVKRYWLAGTAIKLSGPPVDPVATDLMIRYKVGSRRVVTLNRSSDAEELIEGDATDRYERTIMDREVKLIEVVNKPSVKDNSAYSLAFGIENLTIKMKVGNAMVEAPRPLLQVLKLGTGSGSVSASGEILSTGTNVQNIPDPLGKMIFQAIGSQVIESIKVGTIPLPNRKVNPNETWKGATRIHTLVPESQFLSGAGGGGVPPLPKAKVKEYKYREEVAYTFLGARDRAGRKEGIVRVEGTILPLGAAPGSSASGTLKGFVLIELDSGMVVEATIQQAYEIDSTEGGVKKKISGQEQFKLTRSAN